MLLKRLSHRLLIAFLLVALLPLLVSYGFTYGRARVDLRAQEARHLQTAVDFKARQLEDYVRERVRSVQILAVTPQMAAALQTFSAVWGPQGIDSPSFQAGEAQHRKFLEYVASEAGYADLYLVNRAGQLVYSLGQGSDLGSKLQGPEQRDNQLAMAVSYASDYHQSEISDFTYYPPLQAPAAFMAAPIFVAGVLQGSVAFRLSNAELYDITADYTGLGQTGETLITQQQGDELVYLTPLRFDRSAAFRLRVAVTSAEAQMLLPGDRSKTLKLAQDYRGEEVLYAHRYLPILRWHLVVKRDSAEAFATIAQLGNIFALIVGLSVVLALLLGLAMSARIAKPIERLTRTVQRLAAGDLSSRTQVQQNDEIGDLALAFNQMAVELGEAQRKMQDYNAELEVEVGARTQDINEAMTSLQTLKVKAEAANRTKSEFLANMSHEIRTPLNGVVGMVSLLQRSQLNEDQQEITAVITSSADVLLSIVDDILDFSKIESGKLELESINFSLQELCDEVSDILAFKAEKKGLEFTCFLAPELDPFVIGDPVRLRQVLLNLGFNAIKFTETGEVAIRGEVIEARDTDLQLQLIVRDTGIGIASAQLDMVFSPFSQGDGSTTRTFGGTGLGLAICKRLLDAMGGCIGVDSKLGLGTEFTVDVTLQRQPLASQCRHHLSMDLSGKLILIVDDNATNRQVLRRQLSVWHAIVDEATSAAEALERMSFSQRAGHPFDLALVDMHMPETDGLMLAKDIKCHAELQHTPLILLSSMSGVSEDRQKLHQWFAYCLSKPVRLADLHRCLDSQFNQSKTLLVDVSTEAQSTAVLAGTSELELVLNVLVAEDNAVNQMVISKMLEKLNHQVDCVNNGEEALKALQQVAYDLVLMDCQMPVMDGYEATRLIKAHKNIPAMPVIALTANALKGDRAKCLDAGMDDYLTKPLKLEQLKKALARWSPSH